MYMYMYISPRDQPFAHFLIIIADTLNPAQVHPALLSAINSSLSQSDPIEYLGTVNGLVVSTPHPKP